jgi:hypothetical protein
MWCWKVDGGLEKWREAGTESEGHLERKEIGWLFEIWIGKRAEMKGKGQPCTVISSSRTELSHDVEKKKHGNVRFEHSCESSAVGLRRVRGTMRGNSRIEVMAFFGQTEMSAR